MMAHNTRPTIYNNTLHPSPNHTLHQSLLHPSPNHQRTCKQQRPVVLQACGAYRQIISPTARKHERRLAGATDEEGVMLHVLRCVCACHVECDMSPAVFLTAALPKQNICMSKGAPVECWRRYRRRQHKRHHGLAPRDEVLAGAVSNSREPRGGVVASTIVHADNSWSWAQQHNAAQRPIACDAASLRRPTWSTRRRAQQQAPQAADHAPRKCQ